MDSFIYYDEEKKLMIHIYEDNEGRLCPYAFLEGPIFKQYAAYISMKKDLIDCIQAISYLKIINDDNTIPQIVKSSLLFSTIVKYAKCFTSGEGRGTSLNKSTVFRNEYSSLLDFHDTTMELRNKYLAHAGNSEHEFRAILAILNPDKENKKREKIVYSGIRLKDDDVHIDDYMELFQGVMEHVDKKIETLLPIVNQKADEIELEELYKKSKIPDPDKFIPFDVNFI